MTVPVRFPALFLFAALSASASGQTQRLKDDDLRELMEEVKKDVERFADAIDSQYRTARIQTPTTEIAVDGYLKDLKKSAETMRDRFQEDYAAGREVIAFLQKARPIEDRAASGGGLFGAEKEWPRLRGTLATLSREYGVDFRASPDSWVAMRSNDRDLREAIEKLKKSGESFEKSLDSALEHVSNVPSAERKNAMTAIDKLSDAANGVKDAAGNGGDASGELGLLNASMADIRGFLEKYGLSDSVGSTFRTLATDLAAVSSAFH
jgi:hypothetical protein